MRKRQKKHVARDKKRNCRQKKVKGFKGNLTRR